MNKIAIVIMSLACFSIQAMEIPFEVLFRQLNFKENGYHIGKIGFQIRELMSSYSEWNQLIESSEGREALVAYVARNCFTEGTLIASKVKTVFYLDLPAIHIWLKAYLDSNSKEKEKLENQEFHKLLCIDSVSFINYLRILNIVFSGKDSKGRTWLMSAIISGSIKIAEFLITHAQELAINLTAKDVNGQTAYDYAMQCNYQQLAVLCTK